MTDVSEPLSLDQVRQHLRLDASATEDDEQITNLIADAREFVEAETGLVLVQRQIIETARQLGAWIDLRSWPVISVDAIRYPALGVLTPLVAGSWLTSLKSRPVRLLPASWGWGVGALSCAPASLPIEIDVTAGYADPDAIPRRATRAMLLLIAHWYTNREGAVAGAAAAAVELPLGVNELLRKLKMKTL